MNKFKSGIVSSVANKSPDEIVITVDGENFSSTSHHVFFLTRPGLLDGQVVFGEAQHLKVGDELIKEWVPPETPVFPTI